MDGNKCITLDAWRQASKISFKSVIKDSSYRFAIVFLASLQKMSLSSLVLMRQVLVSQCGCTKCSVLLILTNSDKEIILSPSGWLNDSIISAAQKLMLQHFPLISELQSPTLQHAWGFDMHRGDFVQILHVHNSVVSNIGCEDGVVNYYDSMYPSVSSITVQLIASIVFRL